MSLQRIFRLVLILSLVVASAWAQSVVSGTVTDTRHAPVAGAKVWLRAHGVDHASATTDAAGRFQFHDVVAGSWEIRIDNGTLQPVEYELKVTNDQPVNVEITMPDKQVVQQEVTVVATKVAEDPHQVPAPIQVFSGQEQDDRNARDLRGALALATGVEIAPGGDAGPASSVPDFWGVKEFDAFGLLNDGVPFGGTFNPALTALNLRDVDHIEVMRGPAAVTYGATSFVGVINVVHNSPESTERTLELWGGTLGTGGGSFSSPLPLPGEWKSRITLEGERQGTEDDRTSFARGHGLWRVERKWDSEHRFWFDVDYDYLNQEPASPRFVDPATATVVSPLDLNYNPQGAFLDDHRFSFIAGGDKPVGEDWHWYTTGSVSYDSQPIFRGFLVDFVDPLPPPAAPNAHGFRENIQLADVYYDTHWVKRYREFLFIVGADYQHGTGNAQGADFDYNVPLNAALTFVPTPGDLDFHIGDNRDFLGPYAQMEWSPFERLRVDVGLRLNLTHESQLVVDGGAGDSATESRTDFHPATNVGVSFTAWQGGESDVMLYADYRDTFKPAAIDFGIGEEEGGDLILKPETSRSVEAGLKGRFLQRRLEMEASGFWMNFHNLVVPASVGGVPELINAGRQRMTGFETGASYFFRPDLIGRASYSYHDAIFTNFPEDDGLGGTVQLAGNRLEMSAHNLFSTGLMYAPAKGFLGGVSVNYTGSRYADRENTFLLPGFTTVDLSAGYRFHRYEFRIDAKNVGDARDAVSVSEMGDGQLYVMTPRQVLGTVKIHF